MGNVFGEWKYAGIANLGEEFSETFDVPGDGPVAGCCSEWDVNGETPKTGSAIFTVVATRRSKGKVTVIGKHNFGGSINCAVGYIALDSIVRP